MDDTRSVLVRLGGLRGIPCWIALLYLLAATPLAAQLRGPDVEASLGMVLPFDENVGSGPTASLFINHGYLLTRQLYARVGLGAGYRNFVTTDAERIEDAAQPRVLRRRLELVDVNGTIALALGAEMGKWSVEVGGEYLSFLHETAQLTTATYNGNGEVLIPPATTELTYKGSSIMPTDPNFGEYYNPMRTKWVGTIALSTRLTPHFAVGLRYRHHLGRPAIVHTNAYSCIDPDGCPPDDTFRRELPFPAGALAVALRYQWTSR